MTIFRCKNQVATFNKRSAELKAKAIADGMTITKEWVVGNLNCFHATHSQEMLKRGVVLFSECGACVNNNPRTWYCPAVNGRIEESVFVQK